MRSIMSLCVWNRVNSVSYTHLVLGNPRNMNASEGERSEKSAAFRLLLLERAPEIPVVLWDERRTTCLLYTSRCV